MFSCATNSSHQIPAVEIFGPGLGLLYEQIPLVGKANLLERSTRIFFFQIGQGDGACTRTVRVTGGDANYYITTLKIGCQGWTRTNTVRFNKPSCYFDTTWQSRCQQAFHLHRSD